MKKIPVLFIIFVSFAVGLYADNSSRSIDDLLHYFSRYFSVTDRDNDAVPELLGAVEGCKVKLNNFEIGIYKFNLRDPAQKTIVDNATITNSIFISAERMRELVGQEMPKPTDEDLKCISEELFMSISEGVLNFMAELFSKIEMPALVNGSFIIIGHEGNPGIGNEDHPEKERIARIFTRW